MNPLQRHLLDVRLAEERMHAYDPRDDAPDLPNRVRVETMDASGILRRWAWADTIAWWDTHGWRTIADGTRFCRCESCGENTADAGAKVSICDACSDDGDGELDGDAEEAGEEE